MVTSFQEFREDFCDVTLIGEDKQKILAHRVILAASSKFFRDILRENHHPHPIIYMKGYKEGQLDSIVGFIYHGEVSIHQEDLDDFLTLAEELQLKGLQGNETEIKDVDHEFTQRLSPSNPPKAKSPAQFAKLAECWSNTDCAASDSAGPLDYLQETCVEPDDLNKEKIAINTSESKITTTNDELDDTISSMMKLKKDGQWICKQCGKTGKTKQWITYHIEGKHIEGVSHECDQCGKLFRLVFFCFEN